MMNNHSVKTRVLLVGWLMAAAGTVAFTSNNLAPQHSSSHFRGPLRIPPNGEIRLVENLSLFPSSSSSPNSKSSLADDKRSHRSRRTSLIPLYQSSRTETLTATGTTRPRVQLPSRSLSIDTSWLPLSNWRSCSKQAILLVEDAQDALERCTSAVSGVIKNFWWLFPLVSMSMVPLYTMTVFQSLPETPHFWKLVSMDHVVRDWIAPFLISNVTYYMAAAHLFFSTQQRPHQQEASDTLAFWILASGTVSTIFHTVQSTGDYRIAELLCYFDHGVAGTAILYFWHTLGAPSRRTWAFGVSGLACLACPGHVLYPALHSVWHALSALTAVVWVRDGRPKTH